VFLALAYLGVSQYLSVPIAAAVLVLITRDRQLPHLRGRGALRRGVPKA